MLRLILMALLASAVALGQPVSNPFAQIDDIVATLSDITGWKIHKKVPSEILSKENFRRFVQKRMDESDQKDVHVEELVLKMFGLVPQDFNLAKQTVDLVSEQAAAFYDYDKKRLFLLDSTPEGPERQFALVHELAHALADQQHPLGKYAHQGSLDDDESTAREAVVEGQATWLAWAYESKHAGGKAEVPPAVFEQMARSLEEDDREFPVLSAAPLYIRESLVFPYNEGLKFQDAVFHQSGRGSFDELFTKPPRSTQQILHPEAYAAGKQPTHPDPEPPAPLRETLHKKFRSLADGSVGEFDFSTLLRQYVGKETGASAASHWRGGWFQLYEHKKERYPVLMTTSEWDSPEAARQYLELYERVLKGKWKQMQIAEQSAEAVSGSGDTGRFELHLTGSVVQSIEGLR